MNFLIVMPRFVKQPTEYYIFPLGLTYISAALKKQGYSVTCLNLNHSGASIEELIQAEITQKDINVVCSGGLSVHYARVSDIFDAARKARPGIITVVGGGLLSSQPELTMNGLGATFGVIGEGEETIVELAGTLAAGGDGANVKGLIYRKPDGTAGLTPPRPAISKLDSLPYPDYEGFGIGQYLDMRLPNDERDLYPFDNPRQLFIIGSRSCPYSCTFCYHPLGKQYRQRSLDSVFAEMEHWKNKYGANIFVIMDELFSVNRQRMIEFCQRIKSLNVKWEVAMRVDNVDGEMLAMMKASGCYCISYGLESGSDTVLKSMHKAIKVSEIVRALELTYEARIGVQGNFIFGDTAETPETAAETFELWLKLRKHNTNMVPMELYPGTEIYRRAVAAGLIKDELEFLAGGSYSLNITTMSEKDHLRLLLLMYLLRQSYQPIPAQVLSCRREGAHPLKGALYTVKIRCPHCRQVMEYRNMALSSYYPKTGCRECNRRFDLPPLDRYARWPVNYTLSSQYVFADSHAAEIRRFLAADSYPAARGITGKYSTRLKVLKLFGRRFILPVPLPLNLWSLKIAVFNILKLFGKYYLIPGGTTANDIMYHRIPVFLVDEKGVAEQIYRT